MQSAFDDIAFLYRSPNRLRMLESLDEEASTRDELGRAIGTSRITCDRTLDGLQNRGWVARSDGGYVATPRGTLVAEEVSRLRRRLRATGDSTPVDRQTVTARSLDGVELLARSRNRTEILIAVHDFPRTRRELAELTGVSRATLSRNLAELEGRDWIERTNGGYESTARGTAVAQAVSRLLSNLATADRLDSVLGWLPFEAFDFDLACLDDASVIAADWDDPTKSIHHVAELVRGAHRVRAVSPGVTREVAAAVRTLTTERGGTFEGVVDSRTVETIRADEELRDHIRAILESGHARFARHEGALPGFVAVVVDDDVCVCGSEDRGPAHEAVKSDDERVLAWAESHVDAFSAGAQPLDVAAFNP